MDNLFLVTNPGSSSRKYALYAGDAELRSLHFELEGKEVVCTLKKPDGTKQKLSGKFKKLSDTVQYVKTILEDEGFLNKSTQLSAVLARVVATGDYFAEDHLVDDDCLAKLEIAKKRAPLHVPVVAAEIEACVKEFKGTPVIIISDSAFHSTRDDVHTYYAIDKDLADRAEIKRYGYHGLSMGAVQNYLRNHDLLPARVVACHLGSGASITAIKDGNSYDTTMGYTPLEGIMMATRSGNIDPSAVLAIKRELNLSEEALEEYLNRQCGLLGVSGITDDMREVIDLMSAGNERAKLAYDMYIYRVQRAIGEMVASMQGIDALVFTATIGERNAQIRRDIVSGLGYLGLSLDNKANDAGLGDQLHIDISASDSLPIYVVTTNETESMIRRAKILLANRSTE